MPDKTYPASSWNLKPLPSQVRAITKLCTELREPEPVPYPRNRREARNQIYHLRHRRREQNRQTEGTSTTQQTDEGRNSTPLF